MCITFYPAELTGTVLYVGEGPKTDDGKLTHVLGYMNAATNRHDGPNAMILPFPAAESMGPANVVPSAGTRKLMESMAEIVNPKPRFRSMQLGDNYMSRGGSRGFQVFEHGDYTVVMANNASDLAEGMQTVPASKRPSITADQFNDFTALYPNHTFALCCFESKTSTKSDPMFWWYVPQNVESFFMPALDAHDGNAPTEKSVRTDHTLVIGVPGGLPYMWNVLPESISKYLASGIRGAGAAMSMPNGDFVIRKSHVAEDLISAHMGRVSEDGKSGRVFPRQEHDKVQ